MSFDDLKERPADARRSLADEVLNYLVEHPEAQDTVEGVAEWWLLQQRITAAIGNVETTLDDLVKRGYLLASTRPEGRCYYRLNREREREIRRHLRDCGATKPPPARWKITDHQT